MKIKKLLIALVIVLIAIAALRIFLPEDTWICQNGQWVAHGQPSSPQPSSTCSK